MNVHVCLVVNDLCLFRIINFVYYPLRKKYETILRHEKDRKRSSSKSMPSIAWVACVSLIKAHMFSDKKSV